MINSFFVTQCASDIHKNAHKIEGFSGLTASQLLQVAKKAFEDKEILEERP